MDGSNADLSVSIIICTYARADLLRQTLLSLRHVERIGEAEVTIVDLGSETRPYPYISFGSAASRSPGGRKLLNVCRLESIRGSVDAIRSRDATPAYE